MTFITKSFILIEETKTMAEAQNAMKQYEADGYGRPRYVVVQSSSGQVLGVLAGKSIESADPATRVGQHPQLKAAVAQVDRDAPDSDKEKAVGEYGIALVMSHGTPVEVLAPQTYGEEITRPGSIPSLVSLKCSECSKSFKHPRTSYANGHVKFFCPFCDHELERPVK